MSQRLYSIGLPVTDIKFTPQPPPPRPRTRIFNWAGLLVGKKRLISQEINENFWGIFRWKMISKTSECSGQILLEVMDLYWFEKMILENDAITSATGSRTLTTCLWKIVDFVGKCQFVGLSYVFGLLDHKFFNRDYH